MPNKNSSDQPPRLNPRNNQRDCDLDPENVSDPISFARDYNEAGRLIEEEDLDRTEQIEPKTEDAKDTKNR